MAGEIMQASTLIAELNDLLQLDHDAVHAYTTAISSLETPSYQETLRRFRGDHERHITELTHLIRERGGIPVQLPHLPTGVFKLAVQKAGTAGGDRGILLAFKANERQVRDRYRRAAERFGAEPNVADVLRRAASDEATHYSWVLETLEDLGVGEDTTVGKVERAVEVGHAAVADAVEGIEKQGMRLAGGARRGLSAQAKEHPVRTVLFVLGAGFLAANALRARR